MKFIRTIFIVTDNQTPKAIESLRNYFADSVIEKIVVIDHKSIFRDNLNLLPTFNSRSIETMLHRIPNLSSRFIFFNDDFFVVRPVFESDFFFRGKLIARGHYRTAFPVLARKIARGFARKFNINIFDRVSEKEKQWNSSALLGSRVRYFWHDHTPHPIYLRLLDDFFSRNPDSLVRNAKFKFRSHSQFGIPALSYGLCFGNGVASKRDTELVYISPVGKRHQNRYVHRKIREAERRTPKFICMQNMDMVDSASRDFAFDWLRNKVLGGDS